MGLYELEGKVTSMSRKLRALECRICNCCSTHSMTYDAFLTLYESSTLPLSSEILITDFKVVHYIQYSAAPGSEEIHIGATEPMIVRVLATGQVDEMIFSTVYPNDIIKWLPTVPSDGYWDMVLGQSTGVITYREDLKRNARDYDFRNVVFRRWKASGLASTYTSYTSTAFASRDTYSFDPTTSSKQYTKSPLKTTVIPMHIYYLDNVIFGAQAHDTYFELSFNTTILGSVYQNSSQYFTNTLVTGTYVSNHVQLMNSNTFAIFGGNNMIYCSGNTSSTSISNNTINQFTNNNIATFTLNNSNTFTDNTATTRTINGCTFTSITNCTINGNINNNNFLASLRLKTFTPTVSMTGSNPTITTKDLITGDVEQILTAGVLSYTAF